MTWSSDDLARATGGVASAPFIAHGLSIDTRNLRPGALFVALHAERDGHDFVDAASRAGAAAALVDRDVGATMPTVRVADTQAALHALGAASRARSAARVIAVTGSVGKTTTKAMLARILSSLGPTHAAEKSYNNHIGVPLTLAELQRDAAFCVLEIGMNHAGEIAPLSRLARPDVALITAIGSNHIGHLGSLAAIADEKAAIAEGLAPGGALIVPADTLHLHRLCRAAAGRIVTFGRDAAATVRVTEPTNTPQGASATLIAGGRSMRISLASPGNHMLDNAAAAIAACVALGVDPADAANALDGFAPLDGRGARRAIATNDGPAWLLDESYNASPESVRAALAVLALQPGRRIAVLGDMLEMGAHSDAAHAALADAVAADLVFTCGPAARHLYDALPAHARGAHADTADALAPWVCEAVRTRDTVLVKGSFGMRMAVIVRALERAA